MSAPVRIGVVGTSFGNRVVAPFFGAAPGVHRRVERTAGRLLRGEQVEQPSPAGGVQLRRFEEIEGTGPGSPTAGVIGPQ
jgi:hypothetical protein